MPVYVMASGLTQEQRKADMAAWSRDPLLVAPRYQLLHGLDTTGEGMFRKHLPQCTTSRLVPLMQAALEYQSFSAFLYLVR